MNTADNPEDNVRKFRLSIADLGRIGADLHRPECVVATSCGDLYVSDERGGVTQISPEGATRLYRGHTADAQTLAANGFALLADGSFLIAPLAGSGVFRLKRDGEAELFLGEADGHALECPNFVLLDGCDRVWICCMTQQRRSAVGSFRRDKRDGFIVLVDERGARIVADGIGFPNEVRVDPTGRYLYTTETLAARLLRFPIGTDGSLGAAETIIALDESNMFDGFALDAAGGAWITALVSNRLWYVSPTGETRLLIEDSDPAHVARLEQFQKTSGVPRSLLYEDHRSTLRNISSVAFGGPDLKTCFMGSLMGDSVLRFRSPISGMKPAHWDFGPFA